MSTEPRVDPALKAWASPRQAEIIDMVNQCGSINAAAETLQISRSTIYDYIRTVTARRDRQAALKARGATLLPQMEATEVTDRYDADGKLEGFAVKQRVESATGLGTADAPMPGFVYKRVSTLYDREGQKALEWQIQSPERRQQWEAMQAVAAGLAADLPRAEPVPAPAAGDDLLLTTYTLTDAHVGMLAWHREGGHDWDLQIAEKVILDCFRRAIDRCPDSEVAILNQLGDLLHYDGLTPETPTNRHVLDADGRFTKMVEVAVRIIRQIVVMLLEKHQRVHIIMAEGNHDLASSVWLRTMFKLLYENEPRITVEDSALPFYAVEWGGTMQVFHHSHLVKFDQIGAKVPAMFPEMWGRCTHRYVHTGNYHHRKEKDENGIETIQHPTLAARDAYAARGAWFANRAMIPITFHKETGEYERAVIRPRMVA